MAMRLNVKLGGWGCDDRGNTGGRIRVLIRAERIAVHSTVSYRSSIPADRAVSLDHCPTDMVRV